MSEITARSHPLQVHVPPTAGGRKSHHPGGPYYAWFTETNSGGERKTECNHLQTSWAVWFSLVGIKCWVSEFRTFDWTGFLTIRYDISASFRSKLARGFGGQLWVSCPGGCHLWWVVKLIGGQIFATGVSSSSVEFSTKKKLTKSVKP